MGRKLVLASTIGVGILCFAALAVAASASKTSEWEKTVAAAKGEGRVLIMGPAGVDVRDAFTEGFQKKYPGIQVDYNGMAGCPSGAQASQRDLGRRLSDRLGYCRHDHGDREPDSRQCDRPYPAVPGRTGEPGPVKMEGRQIRFFR